MLLIDDTVVRALLPMRECMQVVAEALEGLARGETILPLRPVMPLPEKRGALAMMPAWMESPPTLGLKVISFFPGNLGSPYDSHQGAVLLFDTENGGLLAIVDASSTTAIRTAAASGVATRLLAREDARALAVLGSGVQARTHLDAMCVARPIEHLHVWSRNPERARAYADWASTRHALRVDVHESVEDAVCQADVICTVTSAREPFLRGAWIPPGAHVNAVGSSLRTMRELDTQAVVRARLFVDRRESALAEAGDFLIPKAEGAVDDAHILGEIGDLLLGRLEGRRTRDEVTLFKSLGIAIEDLAAARHVYARALETGAGKRLDWGGGR